MSWPTVLSDWGYTPAASTAGYLGGVVLSFVFSPKLYGPVESRSQGIGRFFATVGWPLWTLPIAAALVIAVPFLGVWLVIDWWRTWTTPKGSA